MAGPRARSRGPPPAVLALQLVLPLLSLLAAAASASAAGGPGPPGPTLRKCCPAGQQLSLDLKTCRPYRPRTAADHAYYATDKAGGATLQGNHSGSANDG